MGRRRRKASPLAPGEIIDYKDVRRLQRFLTERGKVYALRLGRAMERLDAALADVSPRLVLTS